MLNPVSFVTISYAQSIDGRIATRTGDSRWISGDQTLGLAHRLRKENDVILVGIGTVLIDDPELTCRLPDCVSPTRVILDTSLRIPIDSKIVRTSHEVPTIVVTSTPDGDRANLLEAHRITVIRCEPGSDGRIPLVDVLGLLAERDLNTIFVEGGSSIITAFLRQNLVDRMLIVTAPLIIGSGIEAVGDLSTDGLSQALRPTLKSVERLGEDVVHDLEFRR